MPRIYPALRVILLLGVSLVFGVTAHTQAQETLQAEPTKVDYTMGGEIHFETRLYPEIPIESVWVFVHPLGNPGTSVGAATVHPSNAVRYTLELSEHPIPAYSTVEFWYEITLTDGTSQTTAPESFLYLDNRFDWQTQAAAPFEASWYEGDANFGQAILQAAQAGLEKLQGYVPAPSPVKTSLFVYASTADLQSALRLTGQTSDWIAGHAKPELGTVIVSIAPDPVYSHEINRQIPHEVAHIVLYEWLGDGYHQLPQWLREGLPSMAELFPNSEYAQLLALAYESKTLLPMTSLCESFPLEASNFLLAYAQATDFTWYVYEHYGSSGLEALVRSYAGGLGCEEGAQAALGKTLSELESDWRQEAFGENPLLADLQNGLPWLLLLGVVLLGPLMLLIGIKSKNPR